MKKLFWLLMAIMVMLVACGEADESKQTAESSQAMESKTDTESSVMISDDGETGEDSDKPSDTSNETDNETDNEAESESSIAEGQVFEDPRVLAKSCIDKSVGELYALVGEPISSEYAPSCLGPGEDGNLYYDSFIVYTYLEEEEETVIAVE